MRHVCRVCGVEKDVKDFRKNYADGPAKPWNLRQCKTCTHKEYLERRANPRDYKALMKSSYAWKKEHPEQHAKLAREYRARYPEKTMAQNRLNYAVRKGRVERKPCEVCGSDERVHAHHVSYKPEDWYNVKWLCYICHKLEHSH